MQSLCGLSVLLHELFVELLEPLHDSIHRLLNSGGWWCEKCQGTLDLTEAGPRNDADTSRVEESERV